MEAAKLIIEVTAGIILGTPMPEHTRRWTWTSKDHERLNNGETEAREKWICIAGDAREYAASLENPQQLNWVRRDWIWL